MIDHRSLTHAPSEGIKRPIQDIVVPTKKHSSSRLLTTIRRGPNISATANRSSDTVQKKTHKYTDNVPYENASKAAGVTVREQATNAQFTAVTPRRASRMRETLVYVGIVIAGLAIGVSFYSQTIGQLIILLGGVAGIYLRVHTRIFFAIAIFALVMVGVLALLGQATLANNYSVYAYILLGLGTFNSIFSLQRSKDPLRRKTLASSLTHEGDFL
jgi:hypothetical protein